METETTIRPYELAYHITPDMEESDVVLRAQEVEKILSKNGEAVVSIREPKRIHLSYPINHKHYAYFGVFDFHADTENIEGLNEQLKLQEGLLRFLIIKKPELKEVRTLGTQISRRGQVASTHKKPEAMVKPKATPGEEKKIEAELEDVLEKIS